MNPTKPLALLGALLFLTAVPTPVSAEDGDCTGKQVEDPYGQDHCVGVCENQDPGDTCVGVCTDGSCDQICDYLAPLLRSCQVGTRSASAECDGYEVGKLCIEHECRKIYPGPPVTIYNPLTGEPITIDPPAEICY